MNVRKIVLLTLVSAALSAAGGCARDGGDKDPARRIRNRNVRSQEARDSFESRRTDPPVTADTHYAAGLFTEENNQLPQALDLYKAALKREPKHLPAMYRLGVVHSKLKQFPQAVEVWKRYIKLTEGSADAYSNLAYTHELAGQYPEAERAYQKGIARDGRNVACRVNYGLMLARQDKINEAILQFQAVLSPAEVHYNLASIYETKGRNDQARAGYRKAIQLDPQFRDAKERLAALE